MKDILNLKTISWEDGKVVLLDQRALPHTETYVVCTTHKDVAKAIADMTVRGAPAIGVAGAMGLALGVFHSKQQDKQGFFKEIDEIKENLLKTRPTAVNLKWGLSRVHDALKKNANFEIDKLKSLAVAEAKKIKEEDIACNQKIGENGERLLRTGDTVLTHCNAGALATAGFGTALGVIYTAVNKGKKISVFVDETRPMLQGARLTAWELKRAHIPTTVIADSMAAPLMRQGRVQAVIVGADRIAKNGDVANKVGTYALAVNAHHHKIPFYVAAPISTIDFNCGSGVDIPIEKRSPEEVTHIMGQRVIPAGVAVSNTAFDITPHELVSAIITEAGIIEPPFERKIKELV